MNDIQQRGVYTTIMDRVAGYESRKRRVSEDETITSSLDNKRQRFYYLRLESESSLDSQDDTESVYSIQDKETDVVRDSTDTEDSYSEVESGSELESGADLVTLEYDVASISSEGDGFPDYTSSGTEDMNIQAAAEGAFAAVLLDSSLEAWENDGDTSDGSTIFDAFDFDECRKEFWFCQQCKMHNNNPAFRYCEKCFQKCWQCKAKKTFRGFSLCIGCYKVRKTFFPPRPKPSRKRKHHDESSDRQRVKLDTLKSCLKDLKDNPTAQEIPPDSSSIPNLNFGGIVVPQVHLNDAKVATSRTHDASDSDIFDDDEDKPRRKRCKTDWDTRTTSKTSLIDSQTGCSSQDSGIMQLTSSQELTDATESHESMSSQPGQSFAHKSDASSPSSSTTMVLNATNLKRHEAQLSDSKESDSGVSSRTFDTDLLRSAAASAASGNGGEMCIMCTSAPKNGIFLHGSIGHMCCCYKCAMRVWKTIKRCPVCNCKVKNVVKLFTS